MKGPSMPENDQSQRAHERGRSEVAIFSVTLGKAIVIDPGQPNEIIIHLEQERTRRSRILVRVHGPQAPRVRRAV